MRVSRVSGISAFLFLFLGLIAIARTFDYSFPMHFVAGVDQNAEVQEPANLDDPASIPASLRERLGLADFYQQYIVVEGFPIVGSSKVSSDALREAAWLVRKLLGERKDILKAMAEQKVRLAVMAHNEYTTDIPEHSTLTPRVYWDRRARGLGATPSVPVVSCAEENLLSYPNDPYSTENIMIHEFAHAIHETGMNVVDGTFDKRLSEAFQNGQAKGLWKGTYADSNHHEYWAEGVQCWFDNNRESDALHNHVNTRSELREYDPELASLVQEVMGDGSWKYQKVEAREASDRAHVREDAGSTKPLFRWRDEPIPEQPTVLIQTEVGDIEVVLDAKKAPKTVENFLHYVHQGLYADGTFFRTVRPDNQPLNKVKIEVIQGQAATSKSDQFKPAIAIERTKDTGILHLDGTISMARDEPDTAQHDFFICIGDQPELDFGGARNPDGQGFAAFGKVTKGMDVVRAIQAMEADEQTLKKPVRIQRAIRLN